jgi:hypothetical protein
VDSGIRIQPLIYIWWSKWIRLFIKPQHLRNFNEKKLGRITLLLPEPLEKSRNKIGLRTQMKKKILSIYSEEAILQSHVSFCHLTQVLTRYRQKTKAWKGEIGARRLSRTKKPCHRGPAGKRAGRGFLPAGDPSQGTYTTLQSNLTIPVKTSGPDGTRMRFAPRTRHSWMDCNLT